MLCLLTINSVTPSVYSDARRMWYVSSVYSITITIHFFTEAFSPLFTQITYVLLMQANDEWWWDVRYDREYQVTKTKKQDCSQERILLTSLFFLPLPQNITSHYTHWGISLCPDVRLILPFCFSRHLPHFHTWTMRHLPSFTKGTWPRRPFYISPCMFLTRSYPSLLSPRLRLSPFVI